VHLICKLDKTETLRKKPYRLLVVQHKFIMLLQCTFIPRLEPPKTDELICSASITEQTQMAPVFTTNNFSYLQYSVTESGCEISWVETVKLPVIASSPRSTVLQGK